MIAIVNYGSGNIQAIANIYSRLGVPYRFAETPAELADAEKVILPGVGAFDQAMGELNRSGMREALEVAVREQRKPVLGICVGMQLLARASEEGREPGLGWVDGVVRRFDPARVDAVTRIPHMGWNTVRPVRDNVLFEDVDLATGYYFLHSYYFDCNDPEAVLAETVYGDTFASVVHTDNVYGVQFHPEKSHGAGIRLLQNFAQRA